jgi:nucleotide-binding universal stress UspA family protein
MRYQTVLAVINEHSGSTVCARYAIAMAASSGADLVLYSAHVEGTSEAILRNSEQHLDHLFNVAFELGIPVRRISETGVLAKLLPRRIAAEGAQLVFYPLLPDERYRAALQQQTVHRLLSSVPCDLSIMRIMHMGKLHPHHILVPLGRTIHDSEQRVRFLAALAKSFRAQITLFHRPDRGQGGVRQAVEQVRAGLGRHHLPVLERSGSGSIAKAIALEAISHHSDLIVVGASERSALRRLFFGNPAGDLLLSPPCNTILFRAALP